MCVNHAGGAPVAGTHTSGGCARSPLPLAGETWCTTSCMTGYMCTSALMPCTVTHVNIEVCTDALHCNTHKYLSVYVYTYILWDTRTRVCIDVCVNTHSTIRWCYLPCMHWSWCEHTAACMNKHRTQYWITATIVHHWVNTCCVKVCYIALCNICCNCHCNTMRHIMCMTC